MNKKWVYYLAVILLPAIRVLVAYTGYDQWLATHYERVAQVIVNLRANATFNDYMGSWALPVFVLSALVFWTMEEDTESVPTHFLLLPIAYVPFSIIGETLSTAQFHLEYLYVHPLVILPFGYLYVGFWALLIWLLGKLKILS